MSTRDKILKETSPLSIFFVKSGSGGNKLLFRYPFDENSFQQHQQESDDLNYFGFYSNLAQSNPTGKLPLDDRDKLQFRSIIEENDDALCNLFSVNPNLCGQKFEIKINSVRHVGHPMSLLPTPLVSSSTCSAPQTNNQQHSRQPHLHHPNLGLSSYDCLTAPNKVAVVSNHNQNEGDITSFNIVCALRASASYDIVDCYHNLSKRLAIAFSFEERRCSYLTKEMKTILAALDERDMANLSSQDDPEMCSLNKNNSSSNINSIQNTNPNAKNVIINNNDNNPSRQDSNEATEQVESVFSVILKRSNLAKDLKRVFMSLSSSGVVDLKINNWVSVSFCLPQKVHRLKSLTHKSMPAIGTKDIKRCLLFLRPYHGLLLLHEPQELLDMLPIDASPAFIQFIKVTKPDKNFMDLSVDANLTLMQIFSIVSQLIYWAKATVIYPICDSNIYAIHPLASTGINSKLVHDFRNRFPNSKSLHHYLVDFSEGTSLSQLNGPLLNIEEKLNLLSIVTWLLQKRILTQVHKYIFLVVDSTSDEVYKAQSASSRNHLSFKAAYNDPSNHNQNQSSPNGIEIKMSSANSNNINIHPNGYGTKISNNHQSSSIDSSPKMFKNSLSESLESSIRRYRADSLAESQEDSNFGLNSSLSSTPNSNLDYPSPSNDYTNNRYNLSNSGPMDNSLGVTSGSIVSTLQKAGLTQAGAKDILSIPSSRNPDDLRLLIRLLPYFDGKHHIEDIMFFENLERSQVLILCDKFRGILFTCHYEDVAVSQLSPFNK